MRDDMVGRARWLIGAAAGALALSAPASAQTSQSAEPAPPSQVTSGSIEAAAEGADSANDDPATDVVVTGSRIRRAATDTTVPIAVIDQQAITDRGFVSAAQSLNNQPSINRQLAQAAGDGSASGTGVQAPALFGLGTGRTLTLVNGRRTATTSSGLGDSQVDANIIPVGLLQRVEVVQGGAAAVYGSDAIAGVVNYVLRKDFSGIEVDAQGGITSRGDQPTYSARLTAGLNTGDGRGNIAANVEYSKVAPLAFGSRPLTRLSRITTTNAADTGPADDIPSVREVLDARFWEFNRPGVIFTTPAPVAGFLLNRQFTEDGQGIQSYNPGQVLGVPFAAGGEGFRYADLVGTLRTGVERVTANVVGHYDLTPGVTLSTELLYAHTDALDRPQGSSNTVIGSIPSGTGYITFTRNNPYLSQAALNALVALRPAFGAGAPLFLSKYWTNLTPDIERTTKTDTFRGLLSLDGEFQAADRDFNWSVSGSYARVEGDQQSWGVVLGRYNNAINAVRNAAGSIVCGINADASTANDDPACAPLNPFGNFTISPEAQAYVSQRSGSRYVNEQVDVLATLGGTIVRLPGGEAKFSATYEHRDERASFVPLAGNQAGIFVGSGRVLPQAGGYNTDEVAAELLVPLVGGDFTLPLVHALDLSGAYRYVDNSIAGSENVWNVGARWQPVRDLTLRGSRSRNFRAPTLTQLFQPSVTALGTIAIDPCDADRISGGPNPTQRRASCLALFTANPTYGTGGPGGAAAGASAAARLAAFQDSSENFQTANITTGGNPNLANELSDTWTYGVVVQPRFLPGLTITADRVEVDLKDGLSAFTTQNFAEACYDDPNPPPGVCEAFSRLAVANANSQAGSVVTGTTTTFNAGVIRFRGETYDASYVLPLNRVSGSLGGTLELEVAATHTSLLTSSVQGTVFTRTDDTTVQPDWVGRFDVRYSNGPYRITYQAFYLSPVTRIANSTIENDPNPRIDGNTTHSASLQVDAGGLQWRFGVNNFTDKQPSYPVLSYGDIVGRSFYAGVRARF